MSASPPAAVDLDAELAAIDELWSPRVIAELNGQEVKLAKVEGEFVWHRHAREDELFLVLRGRLRIERREGAVELGPGQLHVVPRGVEHRPVAEPGTAILLFEPAGVVNTGDADPAPPARRARGGARKT